jgi:hypothetical protein
MNPRDLRPQPGKRGSDHLTESRQIGRHHFVGELLELASKLVGEGFAASLLRLSTARIP